MHLLKAFLAAYDRDTEARGRGVNAGAADAGGHAGHCSTLHGLPNLCTCGGIAREAKAIAASWNIAAPVPVEAVIADGPRPRRRAV
jgi:hypothetical protein